MNVAATHLCGPVAPDQLHSMLIVLSPAKNLDGSPVPKMKGTTLPAFPEESAELVAKLRTFSPRRLARLMSINPKLAALNHARFQEWAMPFTPENARPAIRLFDGEVYRGLGAGSLDGEDLRFAQAHLRILSGLHGVLRPLDLIRPYRLEMGTSLSMGRGRKDLYAFWGDRITDNLNAAMRKSGSEVLIDLASAEYFRSVRRERVEGRIITPVFKEGRPGGPRMLMTYAKHQRGAMSRWIIRHRVMDPERIKHYDGDGYRFDPEASTADQWAFVRVGRPPLQ
jgi:cytoplasmic iron level regulating protein YaaA (DUF328/UPF0246 family)